MHNFSKELINYNSKIVIDTEIYNQVFNTDKKLLVGNEYKSGSYYRLFPIFGAA